MASPILPRFIGRTASRATLAARRQLVPVAAWRAASTKHPQGFAPPTEDELNELRDTVREFASTYTQCRRRMEDHALIASRARDTRGGRCQDGPRESIPTGDVEEVWRSWVATTVPRCKVRVDS